LNLPAILYQHSKRPEWGYCAIVEIQEDRTTFKFDDGLDRTIRHDHIGLMMHVELDEAHANEIQQRIAKHLTPRAVRAASKPSAKKKAAAKKTKVEKAENPDDAG
jgi:hypothetical protein